MSDIGTGTGTGTVINLKAGVGAPSKISEAEFRAMADKGMSKVELADYFNIATATVDNYLVKYGYKVREKRKYCKFDNEKIFKMLAGGMTKVEVADALGVNHNTMKTYIQRNHLDPNARRRAKTLLQEQNDGEFIDPLLVNAKFAEPKKKPFRDVVGGSRVLDVSCLYGL